MSHLTIPSNLPVPEDDGACDHLLNYPVPPVLLSPTSNLTSPVNLTKLDGLTIVFCYPRTGEPGEIISDEWNSIPGARGCTPQACSFRDNLPSLKAAGVAHVFGLSAQSSEYQKEVKERLHLPYDLLSDSKLEFVDQIKLPTFEWKGTRLCKRVTLAIERGIVIKWFYPCFPSDKNVDAVIAWLKERQNH
ncbi:hypothetical protein C8J56DRAFT_830931 [Mycena floridula]|nr:hypothetical protein C8J56DRAFT_830931 [Mycena floridula]